MLSILLVRTDDALSTWVNILSSTSSNSDHHNWGSSFVNQKNLFQLVSICKHLKNIIWDIIKSFFNLKLYLKIKIK